MFKNFMKEEKEAWVNKMADTHHPAGKKKKMRTRHLLPQVLTDPEAIIREFCKGCSKKYPTFSQP